jgi:TonB family protein
VKLFVLGSIVLAITVPVYADAPAAAGSELSTAAKLLSGAASASSAASKQERNRQISEVVFKNYPPRALANGEQGAVFFLVSLDKDAHATSCQVTHSSGHPLLDEETCDLIVQNAVFSSVRDANGHATKATLEGVVNWRIPGMAPPPVVAPVPVTAATAPEKRICKRVLRTGTLTAYDRTCMTESEWARQTTDMKKPWEDYQRQGFTCGGDQATCPAAGTGQ